MAGCLFWSRGERFWFLYVLVSNFIFLSISLNRFLSITGSLSFILKLIFVRTRTVLGNRTALVMAVGRRLRIYRWFLVLRGKTGVFLIFLIDRNVWWFLIWGIVCSWCNVNFLIYYKRVYLLVKDIKRIFVFFFNIGGYLWVFRRRFVVIIDVVLFFGIVFVLVDIGFRVRFGDFVVFGGLFGFVFEEVEFEVKIYKG